MTLGTSISYNRYSAGNGDVGYELMSLITGLEGTLSTVKISPAAFYFIGKNTAVGARLRSGTMCRFSAAAFSPCSMKSESEEARAGASLTGWTVMRRMELFRILTL